MPFENGVHWKPLEPSARGRHATFNSAVDAALAGIANDVLVERNEFFDSLADVWDSVFPGSMARPGRYEDGKIWLYVPSAPALFAVRMKLPAMRRALERLPGAPRRIDLRLEIRER